jgi:hypothetical protein
MLKFVFIALLGAFALNHAQAQQPGPSPTGGSRICGSHAYKHVTTATDAQIVAGVAGRQIFICDYAISFNGTTNVYLEQATSGTCATLTQLDQTWYGVANAGKIAANPYYVGISVVAGGQLCVNNSAVATVDISVNYDQQ